MEKVIKLTMDKEKTIKISVNEQDVHSIVTNSRSISAERIYQIMNFTPGDKYVVISSNESGLDNLVLEFFYKLIKDISDKVNAMPID